jgi:hypothetical protein
MNADAGDVSGLTVRHNSTQALVVFGGSDAPRVLSAVGKALKHSL